MLCDVKPNADRLAKGLWWDLAWRLVEGCTPVSAGCAHCWAATQAHIRSKQSNPKIAASFGGVTDAAGRWNGNIKLLADNLEAPLHRKKPTIYAVWNDLFHEDVPEDFIFRAFAVMALFQQHLFMILTKRPERLKKYLDRPQRCHGGWITHNGAWPEGYQGMNAVGIRPGIILGKNWPLPNVALGVTAEDQATADERIPVLLQTPAAYRFVSVEPMRGAAS